jgi:hypothetical protein
MGDEWLNDLMIWYNEKEIFRNIDNEKIKKWFHEMKKRPYVAYKISGMLYSLLNS